MEFLYDLDDPDAGVSREIDLDADPALRDAVEGAAAEADSRDAKAAQELPAASDAGDSARDLSAEERPELLVALPVTEQARTADDQHEQRRLRVTDRIATVRDAFRLIGHMGIVEDQRKGLARSLLEVEAAIGGGEGLNVIKDPRTALASATKAHLDTAERRLGPIEE
jgi:hypothetical protein